MNDLPDQQRKTFGASGVLQSVTERNRNRRSCAAPVPAGFQCKPSADREHPGSHQTARSTELEQSQSYSGDRSALSAAVKISMKATLTDQILRSKQATGSAFVLNFFLHQIKMQIRYVLDSSHCMSSYGSRLKPFAFCLNLRSFTTTTQCVSTIYSSPEQRSPPWSLAKLHFFSQSAYNDYFGGLPDCGYSSPLNDASVGQSPTRSP